jgi:S1-C subfamily serine protease
MIAVSKSIAYLGIEWHVQMEEGAAPRERAVVSRVMPNSPAAKAGIKVGDSIYEVDEVPLGGAITLSKIIQTRKPGAHIQLTLKRAKRKVSAKVTLGERPMPAFKFKPVDGAAANRAS